MSTAGTFVFKRRVGFLNMPPLLFTSIATLGTSMSMRVDRACYSASYKNVIVLGHLIVGLYCALCAAGNHRYVIGWLDWTKWWIRNYVEGKIVACFDLFLGIERYPNNTSWHPFSVLIFETGTPESEAGWVYMTTYLNFCLHLSRNFVSQQKLLRKWSTHVALNIGWILPEVLRKWVSAL